jgi:2-iminobutanoate/2-iminopropanoate deaminase
LQLYTAAAPGVYWPINQKRRGKLHALQYSQAIRVGKTVYLSGQIAIDPKTKQLMGDASIEDQTKRVLENLKAVLAADGMTLDNVVSMTVYVKDLNDFGKVNEVYATFFTSAPPARA